MNTDPRLLRIDDFSYELPNSCVPLFPATTRDGSRLLHYKQGEITATLFNQLPALLPEPCFFVFNQSKVIPARMNFERASGARIEIFLLQPVNNSHQGALGAIGSSTWSCLVGGAKKWKEEEILSFEYAPGMQVFAHKLERDDAYFIIRFEWAEPIAFAQVLEATGRMPLPPYLKRDTTPEDEIRYQTVYAAQAGSVAAPTAGLHFTDEVMHQLTNKGHALHYVTLHVGAGTFKPVSTDAMADHLMHTECFILERNFVQALIHNHRPVVPVGTTSMRTLESLYWLGVACIENPELNSFFVAQWTPYEDNGSVSTQKALQALLDRMDALGIVACEARTSILIAPGYTFRVCHGLVTNFHQPHSTLLLLVAAFIGQDWRSVYQFALRNEFRFLSYGDSSLLWGHP
jgi:S-adenosylmethionine:tRNA ribosyltransferase-isomerase